jgi:hypothetical protein
MVDDATSVMEEQRSIGWPLGDALLFADFALEAAFDAKDDSDEIDSPAAGGGVPTAVRSDIFAPKPIEKSTSVQVCQSASCRKLANPPSVLIDA